MAYCPVCDEGPLVLKLKGETRVPHAAHPRDTACPINTKETLLHFNTKMHIAAELRAHLGAELNILEDCSLCHVQRIRRWISVWDHVAVERRVGTLVPDITLFHGKEAVGVIEIFATHAVDTNKAKHLEALKVVWVEVAASETIFGGAAAWSVQRPLPIDQHAPTAWVCDDCLLRSKHHTDAAVSPASDSHRARFFHRTSARVVDLHFAGGGRRREVYLLVGIYLEPETLVEIRLCLRGKVLARESGPITPDSRARIRRAFRRELVRVRAQSVMVDIVSRWVSDRAGGTEAFFRGNPSYPYRFTWDGSRWTTEHREARTALRR